MVALPAIGALVSAPIVAPIPAHGTGQTLAADAVLMLGDLNTAHEDAAEQVVRLDVPRGQEAVALQLGLRRTGQVLTHEWRHVDVDDGLLGVGSLALLAGRGTGHHALPSPGRLTPIGGVTHDVRDSAVPPGGRSPWCW